MKIDTKKEMVIEDYHGVLVKDPYRWLEDDNSDEVKQWTDKQNEQTLEYLNKFPERNTIKENITHFIDYPKYSAPQKKGEYYYFHKNDGLQNQSVFYRSKTLDLSDPEVIIDPNKLSGEGTAAITNITFSPNGLKMAYAISHNGSDWQEIRIKNLETVEDYEEVLNWCKFSNISWNKDSLGFYYNRFPDPSTISPEEMSYYNSVYWHTVGTIQDEDLLIYEDKANKEFSYIADISDDNEYLILKVYNGTEPKSRIYYRNLNSTRPFIHLIDDGENYYSFLGNDKGTFYLYTNNAAPKGRVIAVNIEKPERANWQEIIPEQEDTISIVEMINNKFVVVYLHDAYNIVKIMDTNGKLESDLELPKFITITGLVGDKEDTEMFISYTSYLYPSKIIRYKFDNDRVDSVIDQTELVKPDLYETKQVFYSSKDGTKIPMFITHKKGLRLNGDNPTLLYGYGGYNASMTPTFSASQMVWMEAGGVYAVANLRGGGEYGEKWHIAGTLEKKQNVFDDFIAASEWLIDNKYTHPKRLAIMGGSNGGLLVGSCINQRPDLFGAALCLVPVTDMLRYHQFTVGRFWINEFGNAEQNPEHFKYMYKYSPLHNVKEGVEYPSTLITTADTDDRVVPLHAKKFAARLQEAQTGDNPILLRVEKNAGHGLGKPTSKIIEEQTDLYTFLFNELNI